MKVLLMDKILHHFKYPKLWNYGIFLIMGSAGICPSAVLRRRIGRMRMRMALTVMRMMMAMMMFQLSGFYSSACGVGMNCEGLGIRVYLYPPL